VAQAATLQNLLASLADSLVNVRYSNAQMTSLPKGLVQWAAQGRFRHFTAAEQVFPATETLNIAPGDDGRLEKSMDSWFDTVEDENDFVPLKFAVFAKRLWGNL
jgi:hypothetical protein